MAEFELKFKSIAVRWFINVFLIVAAVVTVAAVIFCAFLSSMYTERVRALADDYAYDFSALSKTGVYTFEDTAVKLSETFAHKDKIEVQVMDRRGKMIVSTTGFAPDSEKIGEYKASAKSKDGLYTGKNSGGESVMARTTEVYDSSGTYIGSWRWITSLEPTYRKLTGSIILTVGFCLGMLGVCVISGVFFIKSIVKPIRQVSVTARKIALGDFSSKIDTGKNDEIGELCDTINYMAGELEQADKMKNDFISSVSHELRTPLTAIKGWAETARTAVGTDDDVVSRGLDVVLSEADRLSGLVEELLDFSRMQNGRLSVNMRPVDITALIKSAADMYFELARQQGIELVCTLSKEKSIVMGDPDRLKQVFINIIDNAVKYTESGGQVLVVQTFEEGCVKITVKDTGVGIPEQDIDHVKEKFFKSNKTVRGSGIGLAVADEIIKQHDGLIFLESTQGVGTTVTTVLPLYDEKANAPSDEEKIELDDIALKIPEETVSETREATESNESESIMYTEKDAVKEKSAAEDEKSEEKEMSGEEIVAQMQSYPELTEEQLKLFGPDAATSDASKEEHLEDISPEELAAVEAELEAEAQKAGELHLSDGTEIPN